jgi:hypothetical protein
MRSDINRTKTVETLRTKGMHTGNFSRPKVKARPGVIDVPEKALHVDNLRIPTRQEYLNRLRLAYQQTTDLKLKKNLARMIKEMTA